MDTTFWRKYGAALDHNLNIKMSVGTPREQGYVCIQKWSQIFVSGTGSAGTESEKKVILAY